MSCDYAAQNIHLINGKCLGASKTHITKGCASRVRADKLKQKATRVQFSASASKRKKTKTRARVDKRKGAQSKAAKNSFCA